MRRDSGRGEADHALPVSIFAPATRPFAVSPSSHPKSHRPGSAFLGDLCLTVQILLTGIDAQETEARTQNSEIQH